MTRDEVIDTLIEDDLNISNNEYSYFDAILRNGLVGYSNQTNKELEDEINERMDEKVKLI